MISQEMSDQSRTDTSSACDLFERLCSEILGEIFVACSFKDKCDDERTAPSLSSAPINVSQVCRRWRQVALSIPRLWSSFLLKRCDIDDDSCDDSQYLRRIIPVIKTWVERSSSAPLDFEIELLPYESAKETAEEIESLLDLLFEQRERWRSASIDYSFRFSKWADVTFSDMHMLQDLLLKFFPTPHCVPRVDLTQSLKLKSLSLGGNFKMVGSNVIPSLAEVQMVPYTFPVYIDGNPAPYISPTLQACFDIFRRAPSLETLVVSIEASEEGTFEHIRMDELRTMLLDLGSNGATSKHHLSSFFEHLTLPSLTTLKISGTFLDYCPITSSLLAMVQRSQASISALVLDGSAFKEEHVVSLLRLFPGLETLILRGMTTLDEVLTNLTLTSTNGIEDDFCPRLKRFSVQEIQSLSVSRFLDCIISRWRGPSDSLEGHVVFERSLQEVYVENSIYGEIPKAVQDLTDEGLKIEILNQFF
ncbi:hypothetical protein SCHPADRAFT_1000685 [Schizopora paradoxa]|uniref:Uncharacterized protein n=1 Tax=Schizopora paradoxa TaxID=27342 RepID=A0A0H2RAH6_9AGAM|nr:hypothetical protein SCHPADRAFT_1000685 [Schizopora paradoxa]